MGRLVFTLVIVAIIGCQGQPQTGTQRPRVHQTIMEACYLDGSTEICFRSYNLTRTIDKAYDICNMTNSELLNSDNYRHNNTSLWQKFGRLLHPGIWFEKLSSGSKSHEDQALCLILRLSRQGRWKYKVQQFHPSHSCHVLCVSEKIPDTVTEVSMQVKEETTTTKLIIGITVGIIACVAVALLIIFVVRRRLRSAKQSDMPPATDPEHRVSNEYELENGYSQISNHPPVYTVPHQNRRQNDLGDVKSQEVNVGDARLYDNPAYNQI